MTTQLYVAFLLGVATAFGIAVFTGLNAGPLTTYPPVPGWVNTLSQWGRVRVKEPIEEHPPPPRKYRVKYVHRRNYQPRHCREVLEQSKEWRARIAEYPTQGWPSLVAHPVTGYLMAEHLLDQRPIICHLTTGQDELPMVRLPLRPAPTAPPEPSPRPQELASVAT